MVQNYSGTVQCSICQSSQDRQSGRRLESMKKNPSWPKLSRCQHCRGTPARSPSTLITGRTSLQAWDRGGRLQSLQSGFTRQIHSWLCQSGNSRRVPIGKVSFTSQLPPDSKQPPRPLQGTQQEPKTVNTEMSGYSLLSPQHQRLWLVQASCSILLFFSPFHPALVNTWSPPTPFKLISQPGDFKRLTNAWISNMQTGPGVVDNNRLWLQKWDSSARHRPKPMFCEYLLWVWPCAMLHICKGFPWKP